VDFDLVGSLSVIRMDTKALGILVSGVVMKADLVVGFPVDAIGNPWFSFLPHCNSCNPRHSCFL